MFDTLLRSTISDEVGHVLHGAKVVNAQEANGVDPSHYYDLRVESLVNGQE